MSFGLKIELRWLMTLTIVAVIFGVCAIGLIVLLIYKSTLTMREDEQLFLDDTSSHMHAEQAELWVKVNRLTIPVRVCSIGSGVFLLLFVAMLIYQKLNEVQ
jgi:O-antigen/teichoic acid export membrane protein